jgi:hypothetical protein
MACDLRLCPARVLWRGASSRHRSTFSRGLVQGTPRCSLRATNATMSRSHRRFDLVRRCDRLAGHPSEIQPARVRTAVNLAGLRRARILPGRHPCTWPRSHGCGPNDGPSAPLLMRGAAGDGWGRPLARPTRRTGRPQGSSYRRRNPRRPHFTSFSATTWSPSWPAQRARGVALPRFVERER